MNRGPTAARPVLPARLLPLTLALALVGTAPWCVAEPERQRTDPPSPGDSAVAEALAAERRCDARSALSWLQKAEAAGNRSAFVLQKISKQYSDLSDDVPDPARRRELCELALAYAQRATEQQPGAAVNVLSIAICYGKLALLGDNARKVDCSRRMHDYAERALALDPNNSYVHHVLGRWHIEVATLGTTRRWLARVMYGGLPPASIDEGLRHLRRATELAPDIPAHRAELGLALLRTRPGAEARRELELALTLRPHDLYDQHALRRARAALAGLQASASPSSG